MTDRIEKTAELNAPIERVWGALTDHAQFSQWFGVDLEGPFIVGQRARGRMTHSGYEQVIWEAQILKMEPPTLFALTWHPYAVEPGVDYSSEPSTLVEFRLEPAGERTRIFIVESGFDAVPAHRRDAARRAHDGGWDAQIRNFRNHVES